MPKNRPNFRCSGRLSTPLTTTLGLMTDQAGIVVYVDVDDTLVRSVGSKRIPMPKVIDRVKLLHKEGAVMYLWSRAGAKYARATAEELKITHCFAGFLPKPTLILDDQPVSDWRGCTYEFPG